MKIRLLTALILVFTNMLIAQNLDSLKVTLVKDFHRAFGHMDVQINENVATHYVSEEEVYFKIQVVPQKEGVFFMKQLFEYESGFGYKNNSILNILKVAKQGTSRHFDGLEPNPFGSYTCAVGDTIMIPVYWNKHIIKNKFSDEEEHLQKIYGKIDTLRQWNDKTRQLKWTILNKVEEVNVKEVTSSFSIHRGLRNESVFHAIHFEAIKPGKFILKIGERKFKIIIYPKKSIIAKVVTQVVGNQWDDGVTSAGLPYSYDKTNFLKFATVRVGDTLTFSFMSYVQNSNDPISINTKITIEKLPFI